MRKITVTAIVGLVDSRRLAPRDGAPSRGARWLLCSIPAKPCLAALVYLVATSAAQAEDPVITTESLLEEMVDRSAVARLPQPVYRCLQASSYNRASKVRGEGGEAGWFANQDWSRFIRSEQRDGRTEWVMLDADGPGCIVRFWMGNPAPDTPNLGTMRVYLDGQKEPTLEMTAEKLLNGGLVGPPLSAVRAIGRNLYLPIPYAKHCKVTYDRNFWVDGRRRVDRAFYIINYRSYAEGTAVRSFAPADLDDAKATIDRVQHLLENPAEVRPGGMKTIDATRQRLLPGAAMAAGLTGGPQAICRLSVRLKAEDTEQALRTTVLAISFDGRRTVWCPVGDFFGTGVGLNPYQGWYRTVDKDGLMTCYWIMPYQRSARIELHNHGKRPVEAELGPVGVCPWQWDDRSMAFHSTWQQQFGIPTRPFSDFNYIRIEGQGVYVGDTLAVCNGSRAWWGEGDEKIFVDGEAFPSHFGTGTEDYYGYSFGGLGGDFHAPFHAVPRGEGNRGVGHAINTRSRSLDAIPFARSIDVNMEVWHWQATRMAYAAATHFYAQPGVKHDCPADVEQLQVPAADEVTLEAKRVSGAIEGETIKIVGRTGGMVETQSNRRWSGGRQLWWRDGKPGDKLEMILPVEKAGRYKILMHNTRAFDYGIFQLHLDGEKLGSTVDLYSRENVDKLMTLAERQLAPGDHRLVIEIVGSHPAAEPRHMLGLDYLKLEPKPTEEPQRNTLSR